MSLATYPHIIQDAFMYFAKFPTHSAVTATFKRKTSGSVFSSYETLRAAIAGLAVKDLAPEIKGFIFGPDETVIKKQIEDVGGEIFLFLDYGNIQSSEHPTLKHKTDNFTIGVTVARPYKPDEMDIPESVLLGDETLNVMRKIRAQMIADQFDHPFMKQILFSHEILPWFARELANSQGWTMILQRSTVGML